jgi:pimeloyl-ACP methyl ester carboxylesterase
MTSKLKEWLGKGKTFNHYNQNIFYLSEGAGECLLMVHGYPYNGFDFNFLLPALAADFRVVIPDMIGMGFSDKPVDYSYQFKNHVHMYRSLLRHLGITEIHVLAHDLGNSVVQELLAQTEEGDNSLKIKSIAFLNGGLFSDVYRPRLIQVLLSKSPTVIGKFLSKLIFKKSIEKATSSVFGKRTQPSQEQLDDFWYVLNYNHGKSLTWKIGRLVFEKDVHQQRWIETMQRTKISMCFINGPADPNSGIHMAKRYEELIPNPMVILLPEHIGHWPQIEAPELVVEAFMTFHKNLAKEKIQE